MNDTLDILNGVAVAEAVSQTAVLEGSRSGPDEGDEAVVCVPGVDHVVEVLVGGVYLEVVQLAVPVVLELCKLASTAPDFSYLLMISVISPRSSGRRGRM